MSQDFTNTNSIKERVLQEALLHVPRYGWAPPLLQETRKNLPPEAELVFRNGERTLAHFFCQRGHDILLARPKPDDFTSRGVRAKIYWLTLTRLNQDLDTKEACRALVRMCARHPLFSESLFFEAAHALWKASGDCPVGFDFYTKRAILGHIYAGTRLVWLNDNTMDQERTKMFLRKSLDIIPYIGRIKTIHRNLSKGFVGRLQSLRNLRAGML